MMDAQQDRIKKKLSGLQGQFGSINSKITELDGALIIETDEATRFKLKANIEKSKAKRDEIEDEMSILEEQLESIPISEEHKSPNEESENPIIQQLEFVNRMEEIEKITTLSRCPHYILINAPAGYGKTRLLNEAKKNFQENDWLCIHIILNRKRAYSLEDLAKEILKEIGVDKNESLHFKSPNQFRYKITAQLCAYAENIQSEDILLIVDNVEILDKDILQQFLNNFIANLYSDLREGNYASEVRVVLSGRYISYIKFITKVPFVVTPIIKPFDFNVVHETVEKISKVKETKPYYSKISRKIASHLMYITGGHPGCMAEILKSIDSPLD